MPKPKRNMVVRKVDSTFILVQNEESPTDSEWDDFLTMMRRDGAELAKRKVLVITNGGGPDANQRKRLAATIKDARFPTAVVSDSIKVRFVSSTVALFHRDHRSFAIDEMQDAYDHLRLTPEERSRADIAIKDLSTLLG